MAIVSLVEEEMDDRLDPLHNWSRGEATCDPPKQIPATSSEQMTMTLKLSLFKKKWMMLEAEVAPQHNGLTPSEKRRDKTPWPVFTVRGVEQRSLNWCVEL